MKKLRVSPYRLLSGRIGLWRIVRADGTVLFTAGPDSHLLCLILAHKLAPLSERDQNLELSWWTA